VVRPHHHIVVIDVVICSSQMGTNG
jgi:hypothetical protein